MHLSHSVTYLASHILIGFCYFFFNMCFLGGSADKKSACNVGDLGSIPGLRRSPGGGKGYPLQYSGLENSMDYSLQCVYVIHL